ncbi:MAG TPA: beta-L-arabinofuranosidase domain-containing protein [Chthonomonadaceae bacterium]|nr:beta-L-arabinofuranosidase domain-containing protein [Chthonomonadaceae bacterium]
MAENTHRVGPVVDFTRSPHAVLRPVPVNAVKLHDTFWEPRLRRNREITLPAQLRQCKETGRIDNFRRASGRKQAPFQGLFFNDSDVYKWAEAAAYSLATHPNPKLDADLDAVIAEIAAAQQSDGYLNTYYMFERAPERFTNLKDMHEIYCAGHLMQAAVAHHRATGKTTLLTVACRLADCLYAHFGPEGKHAACGHEEAEMALVELYREVHEPRYLELAQRMVEARGQKPPVLGGSPYHQDHLPFLEQQDFVGHAVRHLYLACGGADVYAETGDPAYRATLDALWTSLTQRKMYVTGGAGSRWEGEAFGADYELPNDRAYTETCAAIGSVMWNWRMLHLTGETKYADLMEHTLYNAVLPGLSLDGTHYFYQNPLSDRGKHRRQEWFGCACCPPNIARLLASLPGYFYSVAENSVYVHLYASGTATISLPSGGEVTLTQQTLYPGNGIVFITVERSTGDAQTLTLRIPRWAEGATIQNNWRHGAIVHAAAGGYVSVPMPQVGETVQLRLPMPVQQIESHPYVLVNQGRVALQRGPLIYCLEQADHADADVWNIHLRRYTDMTPDLVPDLLDGVTVLRGHGIAHDLTGWSGALYAPRTSKAKSEGRPVAITAIPYYAWANRESGPMQVWLPITG